MNSKLSFNAILKSKSANRQLATSSQHSIENQERQSRLIDIFRQYEFEPNQNYTLNLKAFQYAVFRSRNSSLGGFRSKNTHEDPQNNFDQWIQLKKNEAVQPFAKISASKGFNDALQNHERCQSNFEQQMSYEHEGPQVLKKYRKQSHSREQIECFGRESAFQQNNRIYNQKSIKTSLQNKKKSQNIQSPLSSSKQTHQQTFQSEQIKPKGHFPNLLDQQYKKLNQEFQRLKKDKISEICMQTTKKNIQKQKIQQIIAKALDNLHQDIQQMANQMIIKRKQLSLQDKKKIPQEQDSEEMLISEGQAMEYQNKNQKNQDQINKQNQEKRQQQMKKMIKDYISTIQQAKSQDRTSNNFHTNSLKQFLEVSDTQFSKNQANKPCEHSFQQQYTEFNTINNTFNNHDQIENYEKNQQNSSVKIPTDSVGYSFANSNIICQHSFSKDLVGNQNIYNQNLGFNKHQTKALVYQPENFDYEDQQKVSLPNIEEVRSDCGDIAQEQRDIQSSQEINFRRSNNPSVVLLDVSGQLIKNIQSVHYEPQLIQNQSNQAQSNQNKNLFKNFQLRSDKQKDSHDFQSIEKYEQVIRQQNIPSRKQQKFMSKTFNNDLREMIGSQSNQQIKEQQRDPWNKRILDSFHHEQKNTQNYHDNANFYFNEQNSAGKLNLNSMKSQNQKILTNLSPKQSFSNIFPKESILSNSSWRILPQHTQITNNKIEQSQLSLNHSINQQSLKHQNTSPQSSHQLQSKSKFSITSPISKFDDPFLSSIAYKPETIHQFTEIDKIANSSFNKGNSPIYFKAQPINTSINYHNKCFFSSMNPLKSAQYAGTESIAQSKQFLIETVKQNPMSLLQMKPLKFSPEYKQKTEKESRNLTSPQTQVLKKSNKQNAGSSNIFAGRTFLQTLHENKSIQISFSHEISQSKRQQKMSFAAQTFRPIQQTINQQPQNMMHSSRANPIELTNQSSNINSHSKIPISKITLRSSDKCQAVSPKVISVSISNFQKQEPVKQFNLNNKENVFEKLTIKQNILESTAKIADSGIRQSKTLLTNQFNNNQRNQGSVMQGFTSINKNFKQNTNTLNGSMQNNESKGSGIKFDINSSHNSEQSKQSIIHLQRKQPLLKLSKNLGNSIQQSANMKKSNGQNAKMKFQPTSSILNSKNMSNLYTKLSKKTKQSIGNDSDLDFDLQLD